MGKKFEEQFNKITKGIWLINGVILSSGDQVRMLSELIIIDNDIISDIISYGNIDEQCVMRISKKALFNNLRFYGYIWDGKNWIENK